VLEDPDGADIDKVQPVRDQIEAGVRTLLDELAVPARP
jgi:hypothetical protein